MLATEERGHFAPRVSVLMRASGGTQTLDRAIESVIGQGLRSWELLVATEAATENALRRARIWECSDARIKVITCPASRSRSVAWNAGLATAAAPLVAYLDSEDEYAPGYLEALISLSERADVFISAYEVVSDGKRNPVEKPRVWDPGQARGELFRLGGALCAPIGVAHRREAAVGAGGFDETLAWDEMGDFLKRIARTGATFLFSSARSGRHHIKQTGVAGAQQVRPRQASAQGEPRQAPAGDTPLAGTRTRGSLKVAFASAHSVIDFSNGASVSTLDLLNGLRGAGFDCQAFCTPKLDFPDEVCFEQIIRDLNDPFEIRTSSCGPHRARVLYTRRKGVPITVMRVDSTRHMRDEPEEVSAVLAFFQHFLNVYQPDVMLTYGADPLTHSMIGLARRRDIPIVFALHSFAYQHVHYFWNVDYCMVPSEFARRFYWDSLGLNCHALPIFVDWGRVEVPRRSPDYVTFVNPTPHKGAWVFARIANELARRRPDIRLLVVESLGTRETLSGCGLDPRAFQHIEFMPHTTDARRFWGVTRTSLLPSLWWENQPATAFESMINGIPVIGSDRGGIPEALGKSGFTLPLPARLTPTSEIQPTAEDVEPWIQTIIRLWDDKTFYEEESAKARKEAQRWHPDRLRPLYEEFFSNVHPQPGPPFIPREPPTSAEQTIIDG